MDARFRESDNKFNVEERVLRDDQLSESFLAPVYRFRCGFQYFRDGFRRSKASIADLSRNKP